MEIAVTSQASLKGPGDGQRIPNHTLRIAGQRVFWWFEHGGVRGGKNEPRTRSIPLAWAAINWNTKFNATPMKLKMLFRHSIEI